MRALSNPRKLLFICLAILGSTVLALACVELMLRFAWKSPRVPVACDSLIIDPDIGLLHKPNFEGFHQSAEFVQLVRYNSKGLRDEERDYDATPQTFRILALGDSFVEGHGVKYDELFLTVTERELRQESSNRLEIVKAGVGGWGPVNQYAYLAKEGWKYRPDMVLMAFYVGNDYGDAEHPFHLNVWDGMRVNASEAGDPSPAWRLRVALRKHVYVYGLITESLRGWRLGPLGRNGDDLNVINIGEGLIQPPTQGLALALDRLQQRCAELGVPFVVLILPHRIQVEDARREALGHELGFEFTGFIRHRPNQFLIEELEHRGIPYIDSTDVLADYNAQGGAVSFKTDFHYTPGAHRVLGLHLAAALRPRLAELATLE